MLRIITKPEQLDYWQTMFVYEESNRRLAEGYLERDANAALFLAEQEFYAYLCDVFFSTPGAFLGVWEYDGRIVSAVRVEPFADGVIVAGLETAEEFRCRGFGTALLRGVLAGIDGIVYSHVHKENDRSLRVHRDCGFEIFGDRCVFLDGKESDRYYTLRRAPLEKCIDK